MPAGPVTAYAPGRVNLIGDHTDYTGGLALPMAIDLGTTVTVEAQEDWVEVTSDQLDGTARFAAAGDVEGGVTPGWASLVATVKASIAPSMGARVTIRSTLPVGAGLSSSASLTVATAMALGFEGAPWDLVDLARAAEQSATGVPCGILDQAAVTLARAGHALLLDCHSRRVTHVPVPPDLEVVVAHSGLPRSLSESAYPHRVAACRAAEEIVGPLRTASLTDLSSIEDPVVARRARHVVTENQRVRDLAATLATGERRALGDLLAESQASLRDDYEVSAPAVDSLVDALRASRGVIGARLTGAGFGGCVVALVEPGTKLPGSWRHWRVDPSAGARRLAHGVTSG